MSSWSLLAQQPAPAPDAGLLGGAPLFLMVGIFVLFYLFIVIPGNRKQKKERETLEKSIKRGSKVVTSAGIIGTVVSIKDNEDEMVLRSEDAKLKMKKSMVIQVLGSDEAEAAK